MINFKIKYIQEADSTNVYLKNLGMANELSEGTVILAEYQNKGKGRGQNRWHSEKGQNLTFSVLWYPEIDAGMFFYLTEVVSLSIIDLLYSFDIEASVKWPNDIYVGNNKIAGILIENIITGSKVTKCIAGIGVNVNEVDFPHYLPNPTSIRIEKEEFYDRITLLGKLLEKMKERYDQFRSGDMESMHIEYNKKLYKRNILNQYKDKDGVFKAISKEVKPSGELILRNEDNSEKAYLFGEIEMVQIGE